MSNWRQSVAEMNDLHITEFGDDAVLHLPSGDKSVMGIFNNPAAFDRFEGGGHLAGSKPELYLSDDDADGVEQRHEITVYGRVWFVARPPEPDGTGLTKLVLGRQNESEQSRPYIPY